MHATPQTPFFTIENEVLMINEVYLPHSAQDILNELYLSIYLGGSEPVYEKVPLTEGSSFIADGRLVIMMFYPVNVCDHSLGKIFITDAEDNEVRIWFKAEYGFYTNHYLGAGNMPRLSEVPTEQESLAYDGLFYAETFS
jgi:hypothetical protein